MSIDLRHGDWQRVLADVEGDALITDPPYSERTHDGHDDGASRANQVAKRIKRNPKTFRDKQARSEPARPRRKLSYDHFTPEDAWSFVEHWAPRIRGWLCIMSDNVLCPVYREAFEAQGLTGFHPIPCVIPGMTVRMAGDGPSSWAVYLNVARPKRLSKWGTLPGYYCATRGGEHGHIGGKPVAMMRSIVSDYSKTGDLVIDPCAGYATTLIAADIEGRHSIGAERAYPTIEKAGDRLTQYFKQQPLFAQPHADPVQEGLAL